jgi:septal ring factor EnvC (AmiA/AmiB activator)
MMQDWLTNLGVGAGAAVAGAYAMYRKVLADNREGRINSTTEAATQQVIQMLREEVSRLSDRLAAVEEQNRKCEEMNDSLREEIISMKKQLHLF